MPRIGRWASPDPLWIHAQGGGEALNAYHYVSGNLLQGRDPLGLDDEFVVEACHSGGAACDQAAAALISLGGARGAKRALQHPDAVAHRRRMAPKPTSRRKEAPRPSVEARLELSGAGALRASRDRVSSRGIANAQRLTAAATLGASPVIGLAATGGPLLCASSGACGALLLSPLGKIGGGFGVGTNLVLQYRRHGLSLGDYSLASMAADYVLGAAMATFTGSVQSALPIRGTFGQRIFNFALQQPLMIPVNMAAGAARGAMHDVGEGRAATISGGTSVAKGAKSFFLQSYFNTEAGLARGGVTGARYKLLSKGLNLTIDLAGLALMAKSEAAPEAPTAPTGNQVTSGGESVPD